MSRFRPIHLGIVLTGAVVAAAYAFLPWWEVTTGGTVRGQTVPRVVREVDPWRIPGVRPEIALGLAVLTALWLLLRQGRRPVQDMTTEQMVRTLAVGGTLFFLIMLIFPSPVVNSAQFRQFGLEIEQTYSLGYWVALGASAVQTVLAMLNRTPSYVEPEDEYDEYAEGEYAEGDYAEGEYAEGEYAEGGYDEADYADGTYAEDVDQAGPEDTPRH